MEETAKRVRAARAYAGLTQEDLANRLGVSIVTFKRVEAGKREVSVTETQRIAEITQMPLAFFTMDLAQLTDSGGSKQQLEEIERGLRDHVARLSDLEWRMRQRLEGGGE